MVTTALIADIGESFGAWRMGDDEALLKILTDANVACGFHAGDPIVMEQTVARCKANSVSVGAHPGFADLRGFGRRKLFQTQQEVRADVLYQLGALSAFTRAQGVPLGHVTVHGAMDNMAVHDRSYADGIAQAIAEFDPSLLLISQGGELDLAAAEHGLRVVSVFMADRGYEDDGRLVERGTPGALIHDPDAIAQRTVRAALEGVVTTVQGVDIPARADAVLVHGDTPEAVENARRIHAALRAAEVELRSLSDR